jgi:hypothetical protein
MAIFNSSNVCTVIVRFTETFDHPVLLTLGFKRFKLPSKCVLAMLVVSLVMNSTQQINLETFLHHEFHTLLAKF